VDLPVAMASSPGHWVRKDHNFDGFLSAMNNDVLAPAMERQQRRFPISTIREEEDNQPIKDLDVFFLFCRVVCPDQMCFRTKKTQANILNYQM
jgi:hypothetical protein